MSQQVCESTFDNPWKRIQFHSCFTFWFTEVSIPYSDPSFSAFTYLSTLLQKEYN